MAIASDILTSGISEAAGIITRIATLEARFTGLEQKSDRIEGILTQLLNKANDSVQTTDARIEKEIVDKLDPIKDWLRSDRTKIEALEAGKRYNLATIAVVGGFMFAIFTYYTNQQNENVKQSVAAQTSTMRTEFAALDVNTRTTLASQIASDQAEIMGIKAIVDKHSSEDVDYQAFKAQVTSQNATSITDRIDKGKSILDLQASTSELLKEVANLTAKSEQKFTEVETQFNADNQLHNVQFSDQQRLNAMLQNSLHDLGAKMPEYPHGPFFQPNISQTYKDGY